MGNRSCKNTKRFAIYSIVFINLFIVSFFEALISLWEFLGLCVLIALPLRYKAFSSFGFKNVAKYFLLSIVFFLILPINYALQDYIENGTIYMVFFWCSVAGSFLFYAKTYFQISKITKISYFKYYIVLFLLLFLSIIVRPMCETYLDWSIFVLYCLTTLCQIFAWFKIEGVKITN